MTTFKGLRAVLLLLGWLLLSHCTGQTTTQTETADSVAQPLATGPVCGADQPAQYLPLLHGKTVALVVNHTAQAMGQHLADYLLQEGVTVKTIFAPEHGFRGSADAGATIADGLDTLTGLPVYSLYGKNKKPTAAQLKGIETVVFDIQDVGARFYTYISTLHYVMQACAELDIEVLVLDRPNPNGHFIDGPVLDSAQQSFVGMHRIPVVHGCTVGELAQMINGQGWLGQGLACTLGVVKVQGYTHRTLYLPPIAPSPNLPTYGAMRWYPSLCLFEGTPISVGRGTNAPFEQIGYPMANLGPHTFMPVSMPGKATYPKHQDEPCFGHNLRQVPPPNTFSLSWLIRYYQALGKPKDFFKPFFHKLAGTKQLARQIQAGFSEEEIRLSWQEDLKAYKAMRKGYLLYPDFE